MRNIGAQFNIAMRNAYDSVSRCGLACDGSAREAKSLAMRVERCEPVSLRLMLGIDTLNSHSQAHSSSHLKESWNLAETQALYDLRQEIESTTLAVLSELENAKVEQKQLEKMKFDIEHAKTEEELHSGFIKVFKGRRWVFKDAPRHGTFCGVKDCHSNCHAPCKMEKTMENSRFTNCMAFRYMYRKVTLSKEEDRNELLKHMQNTKQVFHTDEDGGEGRRDVIVLMGPRPFSFKGQSSLEGALLSIPIPGHRTVAGWAAEEHLRKVRLPVTVMIADESEQDTCKTCGHDRKFHYHDEKMWEEEDYSDETVDESTKAKYEAAKDMRMKKEALLKSYQHRLAECEKKQESLGQQLVHLLGPMTFLVRPENPIHLL